MPEIDMLDILDTYAAISDVTVRNATLSIAVVPGP
jgi:hypothetical protein